MKLQGSVSQAGGSSASEGVNDRESLPAEAKQDGKEIPAEMKQPSNEGKHEGMAKDAAHGVGSSMKKAGG